MGMDVGAGKPGEVKSDINVTPLVDVMLVLLIIFMVVTPMLQKGVAVRLPTAANPTKKPDEKGQVMVVIKANEDASGPEAIYIENDRFALSEFPTKIKEQFDRNPGAQLVVKADNRLTYGEVKKILLQLGDAGFKSVGLIAQKKEPT